VVVPRRQAAARRVRADLRELSEETGLEGRCARTVAETLDGFPESRLVFRTCFVQIEDAVGEPTLREPDKAESWSWHDWHDLPSPLFAPVSSLVASGHKARDGTA
jgi:8-oxo-dGTP diphosphatase